VGVLVPVAIVIVTDPDWPSFNTTVFVGLNVAAGCVPPVGPLIAVDRPIDVRDCAWLLSPMFTL